MVRTAMIGLKSENQEYWFSPLIFYATGKPLTLYSEERRMKLLKIGQAMLDECGVVGDVIFMIDFSEHWNMIDEKYLGVYVSPLRLECSLNPQMDTVKCDTGRVYEIKKFCTLLSRASPITVQMMLHDALSVYVEENAWSMFDLYKDLLYCPFVVANMISVVSGQLGKFSRFKKYKSKDNDIAVLQNCYHVLLEIQHLEIHKNLDISVDENDFLLSIETNDIEDTISKIKDMVNDLHEKHLTREELEESKSLHLDKVSRMILDKHYNDQFLHEELNNWIINLRKVYP